MEIKKITVYYEHDKYTTVYDFQKYNFVFGPNGTGKSYMFKVFDYLLGKSKWEPYRAYNSNSKELFVSAFGMSIEINGNNYTFKRSNKDKNDCYVEYLDKSKRIKLDEYKEIISSLIFQSKLNDLQDKMEENIYVKAENALSLRYPTVFNFINQHSIGDFTLFSGLSSSRHHKVLKLLLLANVSTKDLLKVRINMNNEKELNMENRVMSTRIRNIEKTLDKSIIEDDLVNVNMKEFLKLDSQLDNIDYLYTYLHENTKNYLQVKDLIKYLKMSVDDNETSQVFIQQLEEYESRGLFSVQSLQHIRSEKSKFKDQLSRLDKLGPIMRNEKRNDFKNEILHLKDKIEENNNVIKQHMNEYKNYKDLKKDLIESIESSIEKNIRYYIEFLLRQKDLVLFKEVVSTNLNVKYLYHSLYMKVSEKRANSIEEYSIGSQAQQMLLQLCGILGFHQYLNEVEFPYLKLLFFDSLSNPFDRFRSDTKEFSVSYIKTLLDEFTRLNNGYQIFLFDKRNNLDFNFKSSNSKIIKFNNEDAKFIR